MSEKLLLIGVLAFTVAVSGCTDSEIATKEDVQDVESAVHKADAPTYKYEIKDIEISPRCEVNEEENPNQHWVRGNATIEDWQAEELQEFDNGRFFVNKGFDVEDAEIYVDCGTNFVEGFELESVELQKTTFKDGAKIDSREKRCSLYEYFGTHERSIYESGEWEIDVYDREEKLSEVKSEIYDQCLRVE
jgi:hypothetical protein